MALKKRKEIDFEKVKLHLHQPVMCEFYDHSKNCEEGLIVCHVCGFLFKDEENHIVICAWDCPNFEDNATRLYNMEYFNILKDAVIEIHPLKIAKRFG